VSLLFVGSIFIILHVLRRADAYLVGEIYTL